MTNNTHQNRQPKGISVGGQYAPKVNPEATIELPGEVGQNERISFMDVRVEALRQHGYVPATTAPSLVDHHSSAHHKEWWDRHRTPGEYNNPEGGYAQMPDDWTPSRTTGNSVISGLRRTHRMADVDNDVAIRMPSATSIKDFAAASVPGKGTGETFDVPVAVQFPGGQIDGWVRVAKGAGGTWATEGLGFTSEQSAYVAESVQCVLESRRPSRALRDTGDILERRRRCPVERGVSVPPITSTWIRAQVSPEVDEAKSPITARSGVRKSSRSASDDSTRYQLGSLIKRLREERGWGQEKLASEVGHRREWVGRVESGRQEISIRMLEILAVALEAPIEKLLRAAANLEPDNRLWSRYLVEKIQDAYVSPVPALPRPLSGAEIEELGAKTVEALELTEAFTDKALGDLLELLIPKLRAAGASSEGEGKKRILGYLDQLDVMSRSKLKEYVEGEVELCGKIIRDIESEHRERTRGVA